MGRERNGTHRKTIDYLLLHPEIFGVDKKEISASNAEQIIFSRGRTCGRIDVVYFLRPFLSKGVIIVEYKSNGENSLREKGREQVERAVNYYREIIGVPARGYLLEGRLPGIHLNGFNGDKEKKSYTVTRIDPPKKVIKKNHL